MGGTPKPRRRDDSEQLHLGPKRLARQLSRKLIVFLLSQARCASSALLLYAVLACLTASQLYKSRENGFSGTWSNVRAGFDHHRLTRLIKVCHRGLSQSRP